MSCLRSVGSVSNFFSRQYPGDSSYAQRVTPLREGFVGWMGFGGSVFQWHPELEISFAYTPTRMRWYDLQNKRGGKLQKKVVECVEIMNKNK